MCYDGTLVGRVQLSQFHPYSRESEMLVHHYHIIFFSNSLAWDISENHLVEEDRKLKWSMVTGDALGSQISRLDTNTIDPNTIHHERE